jgi:hypothetical protein
MIKLFFLSLISFVSSSVALADDDINYIYFHIQISNQTSSACILTEQDVEGGLLDTPPPTSILPEDSQRFDMHQAFYGPSIILSYQCGTEMIRFISRQGLSILGAGSITGEVLTPKTNNIDATYEAIQGSAMWNTTGSINWSIKTRLVAP